MTKLASKLEQVVRRAVERAPILPVKTERGILVGNVLIENHGSLKNLWQYNQLIYRDINLNAAAIKIANNLVKLGRIIKNDEIYAADQDYGRWLIDSQLLYRKHKKLESRGEYDRADILWARYIESRDRCLEARRRVNSLSYI